MKLYIVSLVLFTALVSIHADPQILNLKEYKTGPVTSVNNLEEGASLYVASNDPPASLNNIQITTGGNTYKLSDLAAVNPDGKPSKVTIGGGLQITTANDNAVTYALTGYLYVTTAAQAQDPTFQVVVVTGSHHVDLTLFATTVVLNTQLKVSTDDADQPQKSTYVQNLKVPDVHLSVSFQWGIPPANWKQATGNKFFMNPFNFQQPDNSGNVVNQSYLFDHVEPLQVGLDYWYITSSGAVTMDLQNNYVPSHVSTTTAITTTGLLVSANYLFDQHTVNLQADPTRSRTVGTMISAYPSPLAKVSFIFNGTDGSSGQIFDKTRNATGQVSTSQLNPSTFTVSSSDITAGVFYCQYFCWNGGLLSTTTVAPATTQTTVNVPVTTGPTSAPGSTVLAGSTATTGSTVSAGTGPTTQPTVTNNSQVTTPSLGTGSTSVVSTTTIGTTTSSVRSLSVLSSVIISLLMF